MVVNKEVLKYTQVGILTRAPKTPIIKELRLLQNHISIVTFFNNFEFLRLKEAVFLKNDETLHEN